MPHKVQRKLKLWHGVDWLPGYLVYKHKNQLETVRKALLK
jgi:hypothetical protein